MTDQCTRCDEAARGDVPEIDGVPAHFCRQCAEHCEITDYLNALHGFHD